MKLFRHTFILLLLFIWGFIAFANTPLAIDVTKSSYDIKGVNILYYEEEEDSGTMPFNDEGPKFELFRKLTSGTINFGFSQNNYWFLIATKNTRNFTISRLLHLDNPNLDLIELYQFDTEFNILKSYQSGDLLPYVNRPYRHKDFVFPLDFKYNSTNYILLKVNNGGEQFHFNMRIVKESEFVDMISKQQLIYGVYFGILLFILVFNLFLFLFLRERLNLHYCIYIFAMMLLQLSLNGYGVQFLWSENVYIANRANPFFASLSVLFLLYFSVAFLRLKQYTPKLHKFYIAYSFLIVLTLVISLVPGEIFYRISVLSINALTLLLNLLILPTAIFIIRKGNQPARIFLLAFIVLIFSVFAFVLKNFGVLNSNVYTDYVLEIGSATEAILLTLAIVVRFQGFKEEAIKRLEELNETKSKANEVLERKVEERTSELIAQKLVIEEKNKHITDSINYAQRIQDAIMPGVDEVKKLLCTALVYYKPKDIVSGDFYLVEPVTTNDGKELQAFAVADCTGHGVPGAFLSMLCSSFLKQSLVERTVNSPADALDFVSYRLENFLKQKSDLYLKDGMDIAFCVLDKENDRLYFSGANRPLFIVRKGQLIEIKGNSQHVGVVEERKSFTNHSFDLEQEDEIYLFSDGYVDQFGAENHDQIKRGGKKFKLGRFRRLLLSLEGLSSEGKLHVINKTYIDWKGDLEQVDDICLLCLRYTR
ncbi:MAG: 7TM diverse intracellular signaling domain-containing protein [Flavobacteriales bacterium]